MEKLTNDKFSPLSNAELSKISGGLPTWIVVKPALSCNGTEYTKIYNWFGAHFTGEID